MGRSRVSYSKAQRDLAKAKAEALFTIDIDRYQGRRMTLQGTVSDENLHRLEACFNDLLQGSFWEGDKK